jgi:hypothetical protein
MNSVFHEKGMLYSSSYGKDITRLEDGKVAVISLPKSGSVWLISLLAECLGLEAVLPEHQDNSKKISVTKFHRPFSKVLYKEDLVCAVYLMRDIRDVIVSYYNYSQTDDYRTHMDPSCYYDDVQTFYFEYFLSKLVPRYNWIHHAEEYIQHGLPLIRYEKLWDDPAKELQRLFLRWGMKVDPERIRYAVNNNSIEKLKKSGKKIWRQMPTTHFRSGGYGGYIDILPNLVLEDIYFRFGDYLRRWGYPTDSASILLHTCAH